MLLNTQNVCCWNNIETNTDEFYMTVFKLLDTRSTKYVFWYHITIRRKHRLYRRPGDMALFSVIASTTFKCIIRPLVIKGVLLCRVLSVHWWRPRTHYDVTDAYHSLCNILIVCLKNGATHRHLRGSLMQCELTTKKDRQSTGMEYFVFKRKGQPDIPMDITRRCADRKYYFIFFCLYGFAGVVISLTLI